MNFKPILFSTPMVQAILNGSKTQTRRVIYKQPNLEKHTHIRRVVVLDGTNTEVFNYCSGTSSIVPSVKCPYGQVGDVLWVREKHLYVFREHAHDLLEGRKENNQWVYGTDVHDDFMIYAKQKYCYKWKPAIHMPKEACRLFLKIKGIRVERLQDISRGDCMAEGCPFPNIAKQTNPVEWYSDLWKSINGKQSWNDNPFVWVIEFERIEKPENFK